jgi:sigma-B regulation protein RsbU (phosphoserine phosphatase)
MTLEHSRVEPEPAILVAAPSRWDMTSYSSPLRGARDTAQLIGASSSAERAQAWIRSWVDSPSPLLKQAPITLLFFIAAGLAVVIPAVTLRSLSGLAGTLLFITAITALAAILTSRREWWRFGNIVAALDFLAVDALRFSTGENQSIFGVVAVLPAVWMASNVGRRYIAVTCVGITTVFVIPLLTTLTDPSNTTMLFRGLFDILVLTAASAIVNELARLARWHYDEVFARKLALTEELQHGAQVQRALLPKGGSPLSGYEVAGACIPAKDVGGDFYDWYPTPEGLAFTLGDVMGKGVGAGMIAATTHALVRSARNDDDPVVALERADASLTSELGEMGSFVTMFHGRLDAEAGRVRYCDAGHGLTLHVRADGSWDRIATYDLPIGLGVAADWSAHELLLQEGDTLISFSDGILDLCDGTLAAANNIAGFVTGAGTAAEIVEVIAGFAQDSSNQDDMTVLAIRRSPK